MKNAFVFPLFIPDKNNTEYYSMMYNAMSTMHNVCRNSITNFDIIIYYYGNNYDIKKHKHFDGIENLFIDFPNVNFIEFPFEKINNSDVYFFKWKCVDHLFNHYKYDKVFITDADLIFYTNPSYIFDKYSSDYAYVLFEGSDNVIYKVLGKNGIAGGQLLISSKLYQNNIQNIYEKIIYERTILLNRAKEVLDNEIDYIYFDKLSDQYSLMNCLLNSGVELKQLDTKDILYGILACDVSVNNGILNIKSNTNILHYLGPYAYLFLPDKLKNKNMREKYLEKIKQVPLIYY